MGSPLDVPRLVSVRFSKRALARRPQRTFHKNHPCDRTANAIQLALSGVETAASWECVKKYHRQVLCEILSLNCVFSDFLGCLSCVVFASLLVSTLVFQASNSRHHKAAAKNSCAYADFRRTFLNGDFEVAAHAHG